MLLRVRPLAAVSEQTRGDFASDERLKQGGEGEEEDERGTQTVAPAPGSRPLGGGGGGPTTVI